jgi:hypothetical protein
MIPRFLYGALSFLIILAHVIWYFRFVVQARLFPPTW